MSERRDSPEYVLPEQNLRFVNTLESRNGNRLVVVEGWSDDLMHDIIAKSKQPHIVAATPGDSERRFASEETFKSWISEKKLSARDKLNGRIMYSLLDPQTGELAGIIRYCRKDLPIGAQLNGLSNVDREVDDIVAYASLEDDIPTHDFAIRLYEGYLGQGLADPFMESSLKDFLVRTGSGNECEGIWLQTEADNIKAQRVYTRFGYEPIYQDPNTGRITMILNVRG